MPPMANRIQDEGQLRRRQPVRAAFRRKDGVSTWLGALTKAE